MIFLALEIVSHNRPLLYIISNCQRPFYSYTFLFKFLMSMSFGARSEMIRFGLDVVRATFCLRVLVAHLRFQQFWFLFKLIVCFSPKWHIGIGKWSTIDELHKPRCVINDSQAATAIGNVSQHTLLIIQLKNIMV